jgi:hypothetical protein
MPRLTISATHLDGFAAALHHHPLTHKKRG